MISGDGLSFLPLYLILRLYGFLQINCEQNVHKSGDVAIVVTVTHAYVITFLTVSSQTRYRTGAAVSTQFAWTSLAVSGCVLNHGCAALNR